MMDYRERWQLKEYRYEQRIVRRVHLFHAGLGLLMFVFLLTFWNLQVVQGDEYARMAESNRIRRLPDPPMRGVIYDRNEQVLASTRPALNLVLRREGLQNAGEQLQNLAPILGESYESLESRLERMRGRASFESLVLREDVSLRELALIESRRELFPSVEVQQAARRDYPDGPAVAHALGYVGEVTESQLTSMGSAAGVFRGDLVGKSGIERVYDDTLRGRRGWKLVTVNSLGRPFGEAQPAERPIHGDYLHSTLDARLQRALLEAMGDESGGAVFMDPRTGEILALASTPAFDPNVFASRMSWDDWQKIQTDRRRPLHDRAIASFYAPGSTFKVLMSVMALETGTVTPDTIIHCGGSANLYGRNFLCWKKGGHGAVKLHHALVHSCNVYFYQVGRMAGIEAIHRYGAMFNLGRRTGIDLPGEAAGILPSNEWKMRTRGEPWYSGETISVAIGQGLLAVTPVQMATLLSAVATGQLPRPHLVRGGRWDPVPLPVSPDTLERVREALRDVVEEGTGRRAALGPISVAGKTGTAQVFKHSAGIDADKLPKDERDHAWFVGYAPAEAPEIAFAVVIEHGGHGGTTAAPVVRKVLSAYFADRLPRPVPPGELQAELGRAGDSGVRATTTR
jgi:penicillin-binding protein 2